jgi:hypothetical protein
MTEVEQESRLSRWSRRKQQTAEQTREEDIAFELKQPIPDEHKFAENELVGNESDDGLSEIQQAGEVQEPVLSDADMEPIDSLTENSDFSKFMSPGVSDELRNLALRKMFRAPIFNIRDGLDEYDEDYTTFEKLGDIVTCDMRHQMELEAERKAEAEAKAMAESTLKSEKLNADDESEQSRAVATEDEDLDDSDVETGLDESAIEDSGLNKDVAANQAVENITK